MDLPTYAQGKLTMDDLVGNSFDRRIAQFTEPQQRELKDIRRKLKNRVIRILP